MKKEKFNFSVLSFATDGDLTYQSVSVKNIEKWNPKKRPFLDSEELLYIDDQLHIIKRGRYRFVSHKIVKLNKNDTIIKLDERKSISNLPSIVLGENKLSKMHDFLPLKLFDINTFSILEYANRYDSCAYFLPFTLLIEALSNSNLRIEERVDFLV